MNTPQPCWDPTPINLWVPNWSSTLCDLGVFVYQPGEQIAKSEMTVGWRGRRSPLWDELFGTHRHLDGSVQGRYSHITAEMRCRLLDGLTDLWNTALDQRMNYRVGSPVRLDTLLRQRRSLGEF